MSVRATQRWDLGGGSAIDALLRVDNEGNARFFEPGAPRSWLLGVKWRQVF